MILFVLLRQHKTKHELIRQGILWKDLSEDYNINTASNKMNETVSFEDVLILAGCDIMAKSGNIKCPFCQKMSFKIYPDQRAKCHNKSCNWYGDSAQFYSDYKEISRLEAIRELSSKLDLKKSIIQTKEQTYNEAKKSLSEDYKFLSWCRIYFAFYGDKVVNQKVYADKCGLSKSEFSRIINGIMGSATTWRKVLNILRQEINIDRLKRDIKKGSQYFIDDIPPEYIKKYRIKNKKK